MTDIEIARGTKLNKISGVARKLGINSSELEKLVITDSIPLTKEKQSDKIEVLSMAPLYARIIKALEEGKSLSKVHQAFANEHYSNRKR